MSILLIIVHTITGHSLSLRRFSLGFIHIVPFRPFSYIMIFLYSGFTSQIMPINTPSNSMSKILSLGSDVWIYDPGSSKICTDLPSGASIIDYINSASSVMVGVVAYSRGIYVCWVLPSAHVLPLILPHCLSLMILTDRNDLYSSCWYMSDGYCGHKTVS